MNFPVHYFIPGFEPVVCYRGAFTEEECDGIIDTCELIAHQQGFQKGRIGGSSEARVDEAVRVTDLVWLDPNRENDWIHHKIAAVTGRVNHDKFQLDLAGLDGFQYSVYDGAEKGHYDWHIDCQAEPRNPSEHRKLSVVVVLTNPEEYEGGELVLNTSGNPDKSRSLKAKKGDILFFYSFVPHMVSPVTSGVRKTLVTWAVGEKYR